MDGVTIGGRIDIPVEDLGVVHLGQRRRHGRCLSRRLLDLLDDEHRIGGQTQPLRPDLDHQFLVFFGVESEDIRVIGRVETPDDLRRDGDFLRLQRRVVGFGLDHLRCRTDKKNRRVALLRRSAQAVRHGLGHGRRRAQQMVQEPG